MTERLTKLIVCASLLTMSSCAMMFGASDSEKGIFAMFSMLFLFATLTLLKEKE